MKKSIQHLRGSKNEWLNNDIIVPDGEIALERDSNGNNRIKIGDGEKAYSKLSYIDTNYATYVSENTMLTIKNREFMRLPTQGTLILVTPDNPPEDFRCTLRFSSGETATTFSVSGTIKFSGDDVYSTRLIPKANKHYTLFMWYDEGFHGIVRAITKN